MPNNMTKLISIYARVSTSRQEEEQTIQIQLNTLREFATKNGYTIVREYTDDGWSGDVLARPALDQLRQDAKAKLWEAVLIYDPDRLARRYSYQELVMDELKEGGIEVIFVTVTAPKNPEDKILHGVRGLFAEYERAKISERFRLGKLRKVRDGHILVSEALYGYTYVPNQREANGVKTHGYYEINPAEARVIKMIFEWIADEAFTIRKVVRRLQELDIRPRKSKRGVWSTSTLSTLLRNKAYIGQAHWGSSYAVIPENPTNTEKYRKMKKSSRKQKPEEEWIASNIPVPAIIEPELFARARKQLDSNFALCDRNKKNEYLLGGRIYCTCGIKRHGEGPQHGKHLYYRCSDRIYSFPLPPRCQEKGVNARIADDLVWKKVSSLMSSPELMLAQVKRWIRAQQGKSKSSIGDLEVIQKEIEKLKIQEERYSKAYGAGLFTMEQLKEYTVPLRAQIASLETQAETAKRNGNQMGFDGLPSNEQMKAFAMKASKSLSNLSFDAKRGIILNVLDKVVATQERLEVSGYLPIPSNYVEYKTSDRYRRPSQCGQIHTL